MRTLWVTHLPDNTLMAIKALREAQRFFDPEADTATAAEAHDVFGHDGFVYIGETTPTSGDLDALRASLRSQGCETRLDLNPEDYARQVRARRLTEAGATPEQVFAAEAPGVPTTELAREAQEAGIYSTAAYETALVLMAQSQGNPLKAAAVASMLARTTEDDDLYHEVIAALCGPFPWLAPALVQQGILEPGE